MPTEEVRLRRDPAAPLIFWAIATALFWAGVAIGYAACGVAG